MLFNLRRALAPIYFAAICCAAQPYPTVKPFQETLAVPDVAKANVVIDIRSAEGSPVYKLQCHSMGFTGDPGFDYSGDFECRLSSIGQHDTYSTFLTEDSEQSRDWESRGRFFAADLRGPCAEIPQFGADRSFWLRGMKLELRVTGARFTNDGRLVSLELIVKVAPDRTALRPIAEIVPLPREAPEECKLNEYFVDPSTFSRQR